jgi:hypothetical protein
MSIALVTYLCFYQSPSYLFFFLVEFAKIFGEEGQLRTHIFTADEIQRLVKESGILEVDTTKSRS